MGILLCLHALSVYGSASPRTFGVASCVFLGHGKPISIGTFTFCTHTSRAVRVARCTMIRSRTAASGVGRTQNSPRLLVATPLLTNYISSVADQRCTCTVGGYNLCRRCSGKRPAKACGHRMGTPHFSTPFTTQPQFLIFEPYLALSNGPKNVLGQIVGILCWAPPQGTVSAILVTHLENLTKCWLRQGVDVQNDPFRPRLSPVPTGHRRRRRRRCLNLSGNLANAPTFDELWIHFQAILLRIFGKQEGTAAAAAPVGAGAGVSTGVYATGAIEHSWMFAA